MSKALFKRIFSAVKTHDSFFQVALAFLSPNNYRTYLMPPAV